jgi:hypothetical protein
MFGIYAALWAGSEFHSWTYVYKTTDCKFSLFFKIVTNIEELLLHTDILLAVLASRVLAALKGSASASFVTSTCSVVTLVILVSA